MCPVPSDIQYTTILVFLYLRCLREWIIILWLQKNRKIFFLSHTSPKYLCIISELPYYVCNIDFILILEMANKTQFGLKIIHNILMCNL